MTLSSAITGFRFILENPNFLAAQITLDFNLNFGTFDQRLTNFTFVTVYD
jgi:hypothetical protein